MSDGQSPTPPGSVAAEGLDAFELSGSDQAALEALLSAGLNAEAVDQSLRARAHRIGHLLGLLAGAAASEAEAEHSAALAEGLVDATLARVRLAQRALDTGEAVLSDNDHDALEALVSSGFFPEDVASALRRRAQHQERLLAMLEPTRSEYAVEGGLVARTLARVQAESDAQQARLKLPDPTEGSVGGRRFRLADLVTVAALLLIAGAAIGPMVGAMREQSRRVACQGGLQAAGLGFGSYASDFKDLLPKASPSVAGNPWWVVGRPEHSNSANLYTLARTGYVPVQKLACPGNAQACREERGRESADWRSLGEVSYSFQNLFGRDQPTLNRAAGASVLAVDASPVVRRAVQKLWINPLANSANHQERGQNLLRSDGSVQWVTSPVLAGGENIWLPRFIEQAIAKLERPTQAEPIKGNETPQGADDVFVGP